jgi:hypothetical protein
MKEPFTVRYAMFVGKRSGYVWSLILAVLGVCFIIFSIASMAIYPKSVSNFVVTFFWGFFMLLLSLLLFERRSFYQIIEQQDRRIAELEAKTDTKSE